MFDKISDPKDVILVEGQVPIRHRYTPGVAGEAFFKELKQGRFVGSRCESCAITYVPARLFCERCFDGPLDTDTKVGPEGTVESFTVGDRGLDGERYDEPRVLALIRLDGADTVLVHYLVDTDHLMVGQRVEPVFLPARQRTGSMLDLRGFRAAGG
jgi:uncharacterized OB-fold protein